MQSLRDRLQEQESVDQPTSTTNKKKGKRKDVAAIDSYIDREATMANMRKRTFGEDIPWKIDNDNEIRVGKQFKYPKEDTKPCVLGQRNHRRMLTIVAGSIRHPHRLKHAVNARRKKQGLPQDYSDKCAHPGCKEATFDTHHLFWTCHKWKVIRARYSKILGLLLDKIQAKRPHSITKIKKKINAASFQQCGICEGDIALLQAAYNIAVPDPHAELTTTGDFYVGDEGGFTEEINGTRFYKVFTDGSCLDGSFREKARSGWGAYYAP